MKKSKEKDKPIHDNAVQNLFLRFLKAEKTHNDKKDEQSKNAMEMAVKMHEAMKNNRDSEKGG